MEGVKSMNDIEDIINYFTGVIEIHGDDNDKKYWNTVLKERQSDKDRIKDLEEINEAHKKENGELRKELEKQQSLIKKKIEEVRIMADNGMNAVRFACSLEDEKERIQKQKYISKMISILEELLKGE